MGICVVKQDFFITTLKKKSVLVIDFKGYVFIYM